MVFDTMRPPEGPEGHRDQHEANLRIFKEIIKDKNKFIGKKVSISGVSLFARKAFKDIEIIKHIVLSDSRGIITFSFGKEGDFFVAAFNADTTVASLSEKGLFVIRSGSYMIRLLEE